MDYSNVEMIRQAQENARNRRRNEQILSEERTAIINASATANELKVPKLTVDEQMIFRLKAELMDYIIAHGIVQGFTWDGIDQAIQGGKIVITKEMVEQIVRETGFPSDSDVETIVNKILTDGFYVKDQNYVHTDNNFNNFDKDKLYGIQEGAQVNDVVDVLFNSVSVLDPDDKIAKIVITAEDIKQWYESNANTNAFTDGDKAKLAGIADGAEVNRVDDVLVDDRSVVNANKQAIITKEIIKESYESNPDTNAFTDEDKAHLDHVTQHLPEVEEDLNDLRAKEQQDVENLQTNINTVETTLQTQITQNADDITHLHEDIVANQTAIQDLTDKHNAYETKTDKAIEDINQEIDGVKQEIGEINNDVEYVNTQIKEVIDDISTTQSEVTGINESISKLETEQAKQNEDIEGLQANIQGIDAEISDLKDVDSALSTRIANITASTLAIDSKLASITASTVVLGEDVAELKRTQAQQDKEIMDLDSEMTETLADITDLKQADEDLQGNIDKCYQYKANVETYNDIKKETGYYVGEQGIPYANMTNDNDFIIRKQFLSFAYGKTDRFDVYNNREACQTTLVAPTTVNFSEMVTPDANRTIRIRVAHLSSGFYGVNPILYKLSYLTQQNNSVNRGHVVMNFADHIGDPLKRVIGIANRLDFGNSFAPVRDLSTGNIKNVMFDASVMRTETEGELDFSIAIASGQGDVMFNSDGTHAVELIFTLIFPQSIIPLICK